MKKVLIALDFDPSSVKVAEKGHALAKAMGAKIVLMHVLYEPVYYSSLEYSPIVGFNDYANLGALRTTTIQGLNEAAQNFLDKTKNHLADENIQTILKEGDTADTILETAKELNADIIVLGTHSRKWLENIIMGSIAEKVLKNSTIPLFIIPTKKQDDKKMK
jgi:nucleotide-binding universal stress UspA family protein